MIIRLEYLKAISKTEVSVQNKPFLFVCDSQLLFIGKTLY